MLRRLLELVEQGDLTAVTGACPRHHVGVTPMPRHRVAAERGVAVSG